MLCKILRSFEFSDDGITRQQAEAGGEADIPADLVHGLEAEGYLTTGKAKGGTKDAGAAPENKMAPAPIEAAEVKDEPSELDQLRASYREQTGEEPNARWSAATLSKKLGL